MHIAESHKPFEVVLRLGANPSDPLDKTADFFWLAQSDIFKLDVRKDQTIETTHSDMSDGGTWRYVFITIGVNATCVESACYIARQKMTTIWSQLGKSHNFHPNVRRIAAIMEAREDNADDQYAADPNPRAWVPADVEPEEAPTRVYKVATPVVVHEVETPVRAPRPVREPSGDSAPGEVMVYGKSNPNVILRGELSPGELYTYWGPAIRNILNKDGSSCVSNVAKKSSRIDKHATKVVRVLQINERWEVQ